MKYSLPESASDLLIKDGKQLMRSLSIYEILRRFGHIIRLSSFKFEDFTAALLAEDQSALLAEIHIQLLRTLVRDDRLQQTWLGPPDIRDSVNIYLQLADHSCWPAALRIYLSADPYTNSETLDHLAVNETNCYPFNVGLDVRLNVLDQLCYQFLSTSLGREEIVNGIGNTFDTSAGDILEQNGDSHSEEHKNGFDNISNLKRHEILGLDKLGRRYWFVARRLFVVDEQEDDVRYYTTIKQLEEIIENLNENRYDKSFIDNLEEQREEIERQMKITEELYATHLKDHKRDDGTYSLLLGQDGSHRSYVNNYNLSNSNLTICKAQATLDRDINRSLGNKFCMTSANAFKWFGAIDGNLNTLTVTLRTSIIKYEAMLPSTFLHPCWLAQRTNWIRSISYAQKPEEYAKALTKLEAAIKPVLFKSAWSDTVGFTQLFRSTSLEREELKKIDRQPRGFERRESVSVDFELSLRAGTMVKFSPKLKPVKHQVWKQKGEEYRLTGLNGWYWQGITRRSQVPFIQKQWKRPKPNGLNTSRDTIEPNGETSDNEVIEEFKFMGPDTGFKWSEIPKKKLDASANKCLTAKPKLPPCHDYLTKNGKVRSIFVLPRLELRKLARFAGMRETRSFSYTAKQNIYIWPYGMTPRPSFRACWLYRNQLIDTIQDVALQLKVFYASIRWDELQVKPPASGRNTIVTDEATITIELLKKRDRLPYLSHSEYLIRKVTTPNQEEKPTKKYRKLSHLQHQKTQSSSSTPTQSARLGLRARRQVEMNEEKGPTTEEIWVSEEQLELWEMKQFDEKLERHRQQIRERALREEAEKRRKIEEERRRVAEQERRKQRAEEEAAKRARLSLGTNTYSTANNGKNGNSSLASTPKPNNSINIPTATSTPTTPVLRYFRTEQGQIIRLPASYLQRGTPLILRHVSPGTNQTNTYIIRPQATGAMQTPTGNVTLRMVTPTTTITTLPATPSGTTTPTTNRAATTTTATTTTTTTTTTTATTTTATTTTTSTTTTCTAPTTSTTSPASVSDSNNSPVVAAIPTGPTSTTVTNNTPIDGTNTVVSATSGTSQSEQPAQVKSEEPEKFQSTESGSQPDETPSAIAQQSAPEAEMKVEATETISTATIATKPAEPVETPTLKQEPTEARQESVGTVANEMAHDQHAPVITTAATTTTTATTAAENTTSAGAAMTSATTTTTTAATEEPTTTTTT